LNAVGTLSGLEVRRHRQSGHGPKWFGPLRFDLKGECDEEAGRG
jgi:hypothetical protein